MNYRQKQKSASQAGKNIAQIMKLLNGMKTIMMYTDCEHHETDFDFFDNLGDLADAVGIQKEELIQKAAKYFDVDVEVVRPLDELLRYPAFFGFETEEYVNTGVGFGAERGNKIVEGMLKEYNPLLDGKHGTRGCPILNTEALEKKGLIRNGQKQQIEGAQIFPIEYFNPYDDPTGRLNKTTKTYSIHWFAKSWMGKKEILRSQVLKPIHRMFGKDVFRRR